jgi:hypothetical protein
LPKPKAVGLTVCDAEVLVLIRHIEVMPLDFDIAGGQFQQLAESGCRSLLASSSLAEARKLWGDLVGRAEKVRLSPSTLNLETLWQELRKQYSLKDHPDFASAWDRLRAITADYRAEIQTALPSNYYLYNTYTKFFAIFHLGHPSQQMNRIGLGRHVVI